MNQRKLTILVIVIILLFSSVAVLAQGEEPPAAQSKPNAVNSILANVGTAFYHQGSLAQNGQAANGAYEFEFRLFDAAAGGSQVGGVVASTLQVDQGLFAADLDFGASVWNGKAYYLQIAVRNQGSANPYTVLAPRQPLSAVPYALALPGLQTQQNATSPNLIGGHAGNIMGAGVTGGVIGGGGSGGLVNRVYDTGATVGGGIANRAGTDDGDATTQNHATVSGGSYNTASGNSATVGGGSRNTAATSSTTVGGGFHNTASGNSATVGGGNDNQAGGTSAAVCGGSSNNASGQGSAVGGGQMNQAPGKDSAISGGSNNQAAGENAAVGGGQGNSAPGQQAAVGGGGQNLASGTNSSIGGGSGNVASNVGGAVCGGENNTAGDMHSTVAGGKDNGAVNGGAAVGGGLGNVVSAAYGVIAGGGRTNPNDAATGNRVTDSYGTVGGGGNNQAGNAGSVDDASYATVGGGEGNVARSHHTTVGGGKGNIASELYATAGGGEGNTASGRHSTVGGGKDNTVSAYYATVGGGWANKATGDYATVAGGVLNTAAGRYSFAAGQHAQADHEGAFVWADSTNAQFASTATNTFNVRAANGVVVAANNNGNGLHVINNSSDGVGIFAQNTGSGKDDATLRANNTAASGGVTAYLTNNSNFATVHAYNGGSGEVLYLQNGGTDGMGIGGGDFIKAVNEPQNDTQFRVTTAGGVFSDVGFNTPAADFAEMLPAVDGLEPGDVLAIGSDGLLVRSSEAYQSTVMGVYSTRPGFVGGMPVEGEAVGRVPLAVVGVVPVKVSVEGGAIQPGNLLAASSTPGHAMKARPDAPQGTVIGKAMGPLADETGVILMLVILQ